jgi:ammonia channel protein AmtB
VGNVLLFVLGQMIALPLLCNTLISIEAIFTETLMAQKTSSTPSKLQLPFQKKNYILMLIGVGILTIGYMLMSGGSSADPNVFSEEIFSARRIKVAPVVVLIGYAFIGYAIMYKPKSTAPQQDNQ